MTLLMRKQKGPMPEDDVFVGAPEIMGLLSPSIKKSTFYALVQEGVIVKCKHVKRYYMLNMTRSQLNLPPVDIQAYRARKAVESMKENADYQSEFELDLD